MTGKEAFYILLTLAMWTSAGFIMGWCVAAFQQYTHTDDLRALAEVRNVWNLWIASIGWLLVGLVRVARG